MSTRAVLDEERIRTDEKGPMATEIRPLTAWGVVWLSVNRLDGRTEALQWTPLFRTRRECRAFIDERYGYIRSRPDLRAEPHGWRIPRAVPVQVAARSAK